MGDIFPVVRGNSKFRVIPVIVLKVSDHSAGKWGTRRVVMGRSKLMEGVQYHGRPREGRSGQCLKPLPFQASLFPSS